MAFRRTPCDWDKFMKEFWKREKELTDEDVEKAFKKGLTAREIYEAIVSGNFNATLNYSGGTEQFVKDYESGKYDEK